MNDFIIDIGYWDADNKGSGDPPAPKTAEPKDEKENKTLAPPAMTAEQITSVIKTMGEEQQKQIAAAIPVLVKSAIDQKAGDDKKQEERAKLSGEGLKIAEMQDQMAAMNKILQETVVQNKKLLDQQMFSTEKQQLSEQYKDSMPESVKAALGKAATKAELDVLKPILEAEAAARKLSDDKSNKMNVLQDSMNPQGGKLPDLTEKEKKAMDAYIKLPNA